MPAAESAAMTADPRRARFPYEQEAGVGDARRARVRDESDRFALLKGLDDGGALGELVVLEVARGRHMDAEMAQERAGAACVLAGHQPHFLEHTEGPDGDVFEIADGRSHHVQRARSHGRPDPSSFSGGERETVRENSKMV